MGGSSGQSFSPTQVTTVAYDESFTYNLNGTQLTLSASNTIPNGTVTGGPLTVNGILTCDTLTVNSGLPRGRVSQTYEHVTAINQHISITGAWSTVANYATLWNIHIATQA